MRSKTPIYAKRIIKAPVERVFRAWTDPEELKQWHAPEPAGILEAVSENYVGGNRSLTLIIDGETYRMVGTYKEFDPPHKLVYDWEDAAAPTSSMTTVLFKRISENETELEVSYTNPSDGPLREGLRIIMDHLEQLLTA